jgi:gp16 family phage-associated protein
MTDKRAQVKARFLAEGISISEWAKARGFKRFLVYRVLNGSCKATRGEAHKMRSRWVLRPSQRRSNFGLWSRPPKCRDG